VFEIPLCAGAEAGQIRESVRAATDTFGRIDVLVNNAGIYEPDHEAGSTAEWRAAWQRTLQVNLIAPAELARAATKHFEGRGGGAIINIASRAAFRGDQADYGAYAASKGGLVALNHTIARSAAAKGVVAYAIAPGWVETDMARDYLKKTGDTSMLRDIPMGAMVPPSELANMIVFLASGAARHATGTTIDMNGASYPR